MARPRTNRVKQVKAVLEARLADGFAQPGARFLSTRAVSQRFEISYQTAHRLLKELAEQGLLRRKAASGSYVAGERTALQGVQLLFNRRGRRPHSYGAHLLDILETALTARGITAARTWVGDDAPPRLKPELYPVVWESPPALQALGAARRFGLVLNNQPPPGLAGSYVDAITTDDFSGGACAAELLKERTGLARGFVVLGGPRNDGRSQRRVAGFLAHAEGARVVWADSWFLEDSRRAAAETLAAKPAGVFACNDRLAQALLRSCRAARVTPPPVIGFDNAPIAEQIKLTTVGIPWTILVDHAVELIAARLAGGLQPARLVSLPHEPVLRRTL